MQSCNFSILTIIKVTKLFPVPLSTKIDSGKYREHNNFPSKKKEEINCGVSEKNFLLLYFFTRK